MTILYIDPGTGSMLFSLFIGLAATLSFGLRALILKLKFGTGKNTEDDKNNLDYVIFSDSKRYFNVFDPICKEFESKKIDLTYYTMSQDDPIFTQGYKYIHPEFIGDGNKAFSKLNFLHADILLSTTPGLDVYQWKRSRYVKFYIHVPHVVDDLSTYRMFGLDHYDAILTTGPCQVDFVRAIEKMRPGIKEKELVTVGSIQLDNLKEKLDKAPTRGDNKKPVVLVAPSWGKSAILSRYGEKILDALKKTGYEIIVRPHPQSFDSEKELMDRLMKAYPDIEWNRDNDNFAVLNKADILISDFSGVNYDYSLVFDRPIIYADTSFDPAPYDAAWTGMPIWSFKVLPLLGNPLKESEFDNIKSIIDDTIKSTNLEKGRESVRKQNWNHIGQSAHLAVNYIINKHRELEGTTK
ncbi:MAG: CDP-glycerol glycerophosphotransferase family protein [Sphaerochaetaceae bacterium]|nr:CDP-glycerol glycerophosphotransferase family protein [Sphaerochaetaceae bacterium]